MSVVVVIPSRGRPNRAMLSVDALRTYAVVVGTSIVLAVDADDPAVEQYRAFRWPGEYRAEVSLVVLQPEETGSLVKATNTVSMRIAKDDPDSIIGNLGDDHVCRTPGWDRLVAEALKEPGIAYGNDMVHGEALPTAPFISARIVLALGYYALPDCAHMYIDNAWRDIAEQAGVRRYLPELITEHMHPAVGKADWDASYRKTNADQAILSDRRHYESWRDSAMTADVERVRAAL